jgi:Protein of unknown function (DUF3311)
MYDSRPSTPPRPRPMPRGTAILAGVLLAIPVAALLIVKPYAREDPHLWGFPFFYWYQFAWVFLASCFTYAAYVVISRARRGDRR